MKLLASVSAVFGLVSVWGVVPVYAQSDSRCGSAPSFVQPFSSVVRDVGRMPLRSTAGWLTAGALSSVAAHQADAGLARSVNSRSFHQAFRPGAVVGGTPFQLGAATTTFVLGRAIHNPCVTNLGADLIRAQLLAQALTAGVKQSARRTRPAGSGLSFPSGHTAMSFATATVLQRHFGWKAGVPAYALASYVAASRVEMKRHYLSDVAFGAALGVIAGRSVTIGTRHRLQIAPVAAPGGAGIAFTPCSRFLQNWYSVC